MSRKCIPSARSCRTNAPPYRHAPCSTTKSGRYICHGAVRITLGDRLITADEAQITSDLSTIWTQGTARLIDGENVFCSEAIYARPWKDRRSSSARVASSSAPVSPSTATPSSTAGRTNSASSTDMCSTSTATARRSSSTSSTTSVRTRSSDRHRTDAASREQKRRA